MNCTDSSYGEKPFVRTLDKPIAKLEGLINQLTTERFNPLYHLGTLAIFFLLVLTATGIYLTIFYRPGTETAYSSVELISSNWFGQMMRSIHRYASDAFMVVALLHALKSLASGRFWGSRWLAWVSGWVIVVLTWLTGVLGFWMVWDQRAQWITEAFIALMKGPVAVTFLSTNLASSTFSAFVIALFLHIFIPLGFTVLLFVHVLRLARTRLISPRWMMAFSAAGLILVSLLLPFRSALPANLDHVIESVQLDIWYLGYLVLFEQWGSLALFLVGSLILVLLILLPWLARGTHPGPAVVTGSKCTGCSLCSVECPYHAIEMLEREEEMPGGEKRMARVYPDLCTGCGICVGTCATMGIELKQMPTKEVYREGLLARVQKQAAAGLSPVIVITCQRQVAAGSLSRFLSKDGIDKSGEVISCVLPCTGMVDPLWTKELFTAGASDIALVSCPYDDCANREGPQWLASRFKRRKGLLTPALHWIETAPGVDRPLTRLFNGLRKGSQASLPPTSLPEVKNREKIWPPLPAALLILIILTLFALPFDLFSGRQIAGQGDVRIVIEHHGVVKSGQDNEGLKLPEDASVDSAQILGGERYPVQINISVDGRLVLDEIYTPTGLRKEGVISGYDELALPSGEHVLEVMLKDDGGEWRSLFKDTLNIQPTAVYTLVYDRSKDVFTPR